MKDGELGSVCSAIASRQPVVADVQARQRAAAQQARQRGRRHGRQGTAAERDGAQQRQRQRSVHERVQHNKRERTGQPQRRQRYVRRHVGKQRHKRCSVVRGCRKRKRGAARTQRRKHALVAQRAARLYGIEFDVRLAHAQLRRGAQQRLKHRRRHKISLVRLEAAQLAQRAGVGSQHLAQHAVIEKRLPHARHV
jgi:hypothetical protein